LAVFSADIIITLNTDLSEVITEKRAFYVVGMKRSNLGDSTQN